MFYSASIGSCNLLSFPKTTHDSTLQDVDELPRAPSVPTCEVQDGNFPYIWLESPASDFNTSEEKLPSCRHYQSEKTDLDRINQDLDALAIVPGKDAVALKPVDPMANINQQDDAKASLHVRKVPLNLLKQSLRGAGDMSHVAQKMPPKHKNKKTGVLVDSEKRRNFMRFTPVADVFSSFEWKAPRKKRRRRSTRIKEKRQKGKPQMVSIETVENIGTRSACPLHLLTKPQIVDVSRVESRVFTGIKFDEPQEKKFRRRNPSDWFSIHHYHD